MALLFGVINIFICMALRVSNDTFAILLFLWLIALVIEIRGYRK